MKKQFATAALVTLAGSAPGCILSGGTLPCTYPSALQTLMNDPAMEYMNLQAVIVQNSGDIITSNYYGDPTMNWKLARLPAASANPTSGPSSWSIRSTTEIPVGSNQVTGTQLSFDRSGALYATGASFQGLSRMHGYLKRSLDNGLTWQLMDDYVGAGISGATGAEYNAVLADPISGKVFVGGFADTPGGGVAFIRASSDRGVTWTLVHTYQAFAGFPTGVTRFAVGPNGHIFAVGYAYQNAATNTHGWVARSTDGGASFSFRSLYQGTPSGFINGIGSVFVDGAGTLWAGAAVELGAGAAADTHWHILSSVDGGLTWTVRKDLLYAAGQGGYTAGPQQIMQDYNGTYLVAGWATDATGKYRALVLKSNDRGSTWTTLVDYQPATNQSAWLYDLAIDRSNNLYLAGGIYDGVAAYSSGYLGKLSCR